MSSHQHTTSNRGRRNGARKSNPPATRQVWVPKLEPSSSSSNRAAADSTKPNDAQQTNLLNNNDSEIVSSNGDTVVEVLSWLPAESLLKFGIVSKGWRNIISDKSFRRLQFPRAAVVISGFFYHDMIVLPPIQVKYVSLSTTRPIVHHKLWNFLPSDVTLAASSNGLLCCSSLQNFHPSMRDLVKFIYVCNPATKEYVQIEWPKGTESAIDIGLAYDPFRNPVDDLSNFKLVCLSKEGGSHFMFQVYSSKEKEWRTSGKEWRTSSVCRFSGQWFCGMPHGNIIFASGVIYCIIQGTAIIAFDVELEKSFFIPLPAPWIHRNEGLCENCIGESEGRLHYILLSNAGLQVWFLESEKKWALRHSISFFQMEKEYPHFVYNEARRASSLVPSNVMVPPWIEPLFYKDEILLLKLRSSFSYENKMFETCHKIYLYNLGTKMMEELGTTDKLGCDFGFLNVVPYSMTLAPLKSVKLH